MSCGLCERLKNFGSNKPPCVLFIFCIATLAVIFVSFAYFVKVTELADPDITEEWHSFLNNVAKMEFCVYGNETEFTKITSPPPHPTDTSQKETTSFKNMVNTSVSVQMLVEFEPTDAFLIDTQNNTHLSALVRGDMLGFSGIEAAQSVGMTFQLPHPSNLTQCIKDRTCGTVKILTCVNFLAPSGMFPNARKPMCNTTDEVNIEKSAHLLPQKKEDAWMKRCDRRPMIRFRNEYSKAVSVMLTMKDRSLINLHLMHTSYFLFVMVIMLICYGLLKGGTTRVRVLHNNTSEKITITS